MVAREISNWDFEDVCLLASLGLVKPVRDGGKVPNWKWEAMMERWAWNKRQTACRDVFFDQPHPNVAAVRDAWWADYLRRKALKSLVRAQPHYRGAA